MTVLDADVNDFHNDLEVRRYLRKTFVEDLGLDLDSTLVYAFPQGDRTVQYRLEGGRRIRRTVARDYQVQIFYSDEDAEDFLNASRHLLDETVIDYPIED